MKQYTFTIKWNKSYCPDVLIKQYSDKYTNLTGYCIRVKSNSCKAAIKKATDYINNIINYSDNFELIPAR